MRGNGGETRQSIFFKEAEKKKKDQTPQLELGVITAQEQVRDVKTR